MGEKQSYDINFNVMFTLVIAFILISIDPFHWGAYTTTNKTLREN